MAASSKLNRDFYLRPTLEVTRELIGKILVIKRGRSTLSGRIVEAEAYIGQSDPACHACRGRTRRNSVMFADGGITYVYFVYGMYNMLNFVTEPAGFPAAVLIRALEPLEGVAAMRRRRKCDDLKELTSGPGKLCQALGIGVEDNGHDLTGKSWFVHDDGVLPREIAAAPRIGIRQGARRLWRFYDADSAFVSVRPRRPK